MVWAPSGQEPGKRHALLTIHQLGTWECLQHISVPVQSYGIHLVVPVEMDQFEVKYFLHEMEKTFVATARYQYNSHSQEYEPAPPVTTEPYQGLESNWYHNNAVHIHRDTIRIINKPHEFFLTIRNFLERYGISLGHSRPEDQISIYDAKIGSLLRKLTGLPELGSGPQQLTISSQYVANLKLDEKYYILTFYEIPHHLWQPTLRWIMYLSWLLVIPWPFRYFIRPVTRSRSRETSVA